jgi:carboxypeptidase PM20D1
MKVLRAGLIAVGGALALLVAVLLIRTLGWSPPGGYEPVPLAAAPAIDANRAAARLGEAIRFRTVSHQNPADDRPEAWSELHAWLQATYPAAHAAMLRETVADRTLVYAWAGSNAALPPIVLMAHQDVVPVAPGTEANWTRPPFDGVIADGFVWGRGALDDKGSLVAMMEAVEALAVSGFRPRRTIYLVFGHDEETTQTGAQAAAALLKARGVKPEFVLDEGGVALTDNPVTGRPVAVIAVAEKGYATLRVTARGPGGHSSMPPDETAVHVLSKAIDRIASDRFEPRLDGPGGDLIRSLTADAPFHLRLLAANEWLFGAVVASQAARSPETAAMLRTTLAPTMLEGSPKENVLPERATALINYRLHPRDTTETVLERARRAVKDLPVEVAWTEGASEAVAPASTDSAAWRLLATVAERATGAAPAPGLLSGGTDSRHMTVLTPQIYRFLPVLIADTELAGFHGTNERLSVENVGRASNAYAVLIATVAGPQPPR